MNDIEILATFQAVESVYLMEESKGIISINQESIFEIYLKNIVQ